MLICAYLKGQYAEDNCAFLFVGFVSNRRTSCGVSYRLGDVLRRPDLPEFQVTWILGHGLAQLQQTQTGC